MAKDRVPAFPRKLLHEWYLKNRRSLPWRNQPTPYRVWISEVMLQQTQVATVLPYYERFLKRFPDFDALARASELEVLSLWTGLGYYSRARNLRRAAQIVAEKYGGALPDSPEEMRTLPGIGPYTAGAILSIAFNQPRPILDGNVRRVLSRFFLEPDSAALWKRSEEIVVMSHEEGLPPADVNQALMEIGALVCLPAAPSCLLCPLSRGCGAAKTGRQSQFPPAKERKETVSRHYALFLLEKKAFRGEPARYLVRKRPAEDRWFKGLWEFPMVETPSGPAEGAESLRAMAAAAVREGAIAKIHRKIGEISHSVTHHKLTISVFKGSGRPLPAARNGGSVLWLSRSELDDISASSILRKALALLP